MISLKFLLVFLAAFVTLSKAEGDLVDFHPCPGTENECEIKELRVESCHDYSPHTACKIRRRKPAHIIFHYVPKFVANDFEATLSWVKDENQELPLATLDVDGCKYTTCPTKVGEQNSYAIDVPIESKFPLNGYTIKWNLKSPSTNKACCFTMDIKVVR